MEFVTENATNIYYIKRELAINMQIFAVSIVSGGTYCNHNVNSRTKTYAANLKLHMVTCDNFKQSRIQQLFYFAADDKKVVDKHTVQW